MDRFPVAPLRWKSNLSCIGSPRLLWADVETLLDKLVAGNGIPGCGRWAVWRAEGRAVCESSVDKAVGDNRKGNCSFSGLVWSALGAACACCLDEAVLKASPLGPACMLESLACKLLDGCSDDCCRDLAPDAELG